MNKSFNLLFYVKRSKTNAEGLAPVYLRITIDGVRIEISSKRYVNPDKWNTNGQKLTGNNEDTKSVNAYLKTLEHQVYDVHRDMIERKLQITALNLKDRLLGGKPSPGKMLVPIFQEHNRQVAAFIGKEYAKGTLDRYETSLKHTQAFLQWKFNSPDIDIRAIDHEFIMAL